MTPGEALVALIGAQHGRIKSLMAEVEAAEGEAQAVAFGQVSRYLAVHEAAEQTLLHAEGVEALEDDAVSEQRIVEEQEAGALVTLLESLVGRAEFGVQFGLLKEAVVRHAEAEEQEELPRLVEALPAPVLDRAVEGLGRVDAWATGEAPDSPLGAGRPFTEMLHAATDAFVRQASAAE